MADKAARAWLGASGTETVIGEGNGESTMKLGLSVLVLPLALAAFPCAQAQNPPQAPNVDPARMAAPAPAKPADTSLAVDRPPPSGPDARACLEFPTDAQVIMCAEKYRPRKRQA